MNSQPPTAAPAALTFTDEVVTLAHVRDVALPSPAGGVLALITLDNGRDHRRPTTFGPAGLHNLAEALTTCRQRAQRGEIVAVAITGKPFVFAVGADLKAVSALNTRAEALAISQLGHATFSLLDQLAADGVPSFAFINGPTLGGGVELALSCTYRTISTAARAFALPECYIGLVPGWGGCWRLPNLIGVEAALGVIIDNALAQNRMLKPSQVTAAGIADVLVPAADFLSASIAWAAEVLAGQVVPARAEIDRDEQRWHGAVDAARARVLATTGGRVAAPLSALDLVADARTATRQEGFAAEDEVLADRIISDQTRATLYAFDLVRRRAKKPHGVPTSAQPRPITKVGIVGAGLMAGQIAVLIARRLKVPVVLNDLDTTRVAAGLAYVHEQFERLAAAGRMSPDEQARLTALVSGSVDKADLADADFVIEAIVEELAAKRAVFAQIANVVSPTCVLATNTSSLSVSAMAAGLENPQRVVGVHFFNPVSVMPLVEIIRGEHTDDPTCATAFALGKALRKTCVLAADRPSFIVNRILGRFLSEVGVIVDEGTPLDVVDSAFAGIVPLPPFELIALVGPAIALHNARTLADAFPDRFAVSDNLTFAVANNVRSFYVPDGAGGNQLDPRMGEYLRTACPPNPVVLDGATIRDQVLTGLAQEIGLMLDEGVVSCATDIDLALITGAGMPLWNGGLTPLLDREGISQRATGRRFLPPGVADASAVTSAR